MRHQSIYTLGTTKWGQLLFGVALQFSFFLDFFGHFCCIVTLMQILVLLSEFLQNPPIIKVVYTRISNAFFRILEYFDISERNKAEVWFSLF